LDIVQSELNPAVAKDTLGSEINPKPAPIKKAIVKEYDINVKVVDTNKKPVEGAKVTIHSVAKEALTNKQGIAVFKNVESGNHKVIIAYKSFTGEQSLNLSGNFKTVDLNVTVEEQLFSLPPLAYGVISTLGLIIVVLIIQLFKNKKKQSQS